MQRIFASAPVVLSVAACAASVLTASVASAAGQFLDPGWQIAYTGQPGSASDAAGLIARVFGDGEPAVVGTAFQPAPMYQPPAYRPGPVYYRAAPSPQRTSAAPVYYQRVQSTRVSQPAPVYYRQLPVQQMRAYPPAQVYYQQVPPQPRATPQYTASVQPMRLPASVPAPQYTGSTPDTAPAPQHGLFQQLGLFQLTPPQAVAYVGTVPGYAPSEYGDMAHPIVDPKYDRQVVDYHGGEAPGTVIIDTPNYFLYLVLEGGKALRYGIGVGRPGFTWEGEKTITAKREWPDWTPPAEMLARRPDLPRYVAGGPDSPLGARALYLGSSLYRIHGSNEPWTIGTQVSSGCIRLRNADIIDLYNRVQVGTKVMVL
jgi:lipoprotein-anchoring transpeptidase ErfK/SrfK